MALLSSCPDRQTLQQLLQGQLAAAEAETLHRHVAACPSCKQASDELLAGPTFGDEKSDSTPPPLAAAPSREAAMELYFLMPPQAADEIGRLGGYRVLKVLGSGGMGVVLLAEDVRLQRRVALKAMKQAVAAGAAARERFLREARAMAAVKHDHVVTIYQVGEDRGVPFLVMEFLRGESLEERLRRERRLPVAEVLRIGREMAEGLAAAHDCGLIHRDIKPSNVWLEFSRDQKGGASGGRVKILDFGLVQPAAEDAHLTQSGVIVGTPTYMSPEQANGQTLDHRTDLFNLGIVLYRLCTGKLPFRGATTIAVLTSLAGEKPIPVGEIAPDVPRPLSNLVQQLLAKDPGDRPPSAAAVAAAIGTMECLPTAARSAPTLVEGGAATLSMPLRRQQPNPRRWLWAGAGAAVLLVVLGPLAFYLAHFRGDPVATDDTAGIERRKESDASAGLMDKENPFVLVGSNSSKQRFKTFAEALAARQTGDVIEVSANGPFSVPAAELDHKGLILRAAPGTRPIFLARPGAGVASSWLRISGGEVRVEGCDFFCEENFGDCFLSSGKSPQPAAAWTFRQCRFSINGALGLIAYAGPRLVVEDCLIFSDARDVLLPLAPRADLELTNNVIAASGAACLIDAPGLQTLRLTRNTFYGTPLGVLLRPPRSETRAQPVTVFAEGNAILGVALLGDGTSQGMPSEQVARRQVSWQGSNNLYVRGQATYVTFALEGRRLKHLDDWNKFWGRPEPGSIEAPSLTLLFNFWWATPNTAVQMMRPKVEALCRSVGMDSRRVGPAWDLLGPGAAYVKALEQTTGQALPSERLRVKPLDGGAFILLRSQQEPRGFATLQAALDTVRAGDVIEIRTDEPFPGGTVKAPQRAGPLTVRAGPGYAPIVSTPLDFQLKKSAVQIEGLSFAPGYLSGAFDRLTLRNCALLGGMPPQATITLHSRGQSAHLLHCILPYSSLSIGPGQAVRVENSLTLRFSIDARERNEAGELAIHRSLCWSDEPFSGALTCDRSPQSQPRIHAEDSVFVGGAVLTIAARNAQWSGNRNLYSLTIGHAVLQSIYNLGTWRNRWGSDADSRSALPLYLDPQQWRVAPGQAKRPDGKDYGANVDRIARTAPP